MTCRCSVPRSRRAAGAGADRPPAHRGPCARAGAGAVRTMRNTGRAHRAAAQSPPAEALPPRAYALPVKHVDALTSQILERGGKRLAALQLLVPRCKYIAEKF